MIPLEVYLSKLKVRSLGHCLVAQAPTEILLPRPVFSFTVALSFNVSSLFTFSLGVICDLQIPPHDDEDYLLIVQFSVLSGDPP
jgi:hypothetical protein